MVNSPSTTGLLPDLESSFGLLRMPNTLDMGVPGTAQVSIKNRGKTTTSLRTADQTQSALFWAYDWADTFRPYGQLNQIAQEIAAKENTSLLKTASLFAALNTSLADSVIVAWDKKYTEVQPRPDYVIAGGFAANDGIDSTLSDPNWKPL